jgi:hypothetical protein
LTLAREEGKGNIRSFDVAEPGPLYLDLPVSFLRGTPDFAADMLALAIAIGPDDQRCGSSRLVLDVFGDRFVVLPAVSTQSE